MPRGSAEKMFAAALRGVELGTLAHFCAHHCEDDALSLRTPLSGSITSSQVLHLSLAPFSFTPFLPHPSPKLFGMARGLIFNLMGHNKVTPLPTDEASHHLDAAGETQPLGEAHMSPFPGNLAPPAFLNGGTTSS